MEFDKSIKAWFCVDQVSPNGEALVNAEGKELTG